MKKKLQIQAQVDGEDIAFTIERSPDLTLLEILGLLEHISFEIADSIEKKVKVTQKKE